MADPTKFIPGYSYSGWQASNPSKPLPANQVDNDFANAALSIGETIEALKDVRRSDGALKNGVVTYDSLANDLLIGLQTPTEWATGLQYVKPATISIDTFPHYGIYRSLLSHTSTTFAADLAAGKWELIFDLDPLSFFSNTSALAALYVFSTTITDADPGPGKLRLSAAQQNASLTVRADLLDVNGADVSGILDAFDDSTSTTKGSLRIYKIGSPGDWLVFRVTSVASPVGYRNITVSPIASTAASPFVDGDSVLVSFTPAGDQSQALSGLAALDGPLGTPMALSGRDIFLGTDALVSADQQELAAWYKGLRERYDAIVSTGTIVNEVAFFIGDSKVVGTGTTAGFTPVDLMNNMALERGLPALFGRFAQGGTNSYFALNTLVPQLLGHVNWPNTGIVILNFGTNQQVDGGVASPARTAAETEQDVRAIIAATRDTLNGGRSADDFSILIMGQTPANNATAGYGQTTELMRELNSIYRRVARDEKVAFFDAMAHFERPHADAGWMDVNPTLGNSNIHPGDLFNTVLYGRLAEMVLPQAIATKFGIGARNSTTDPGPSALPSAYPFGVSSNRAVAAAGWPLDGLVTTARSPTKIATQILSSYITGDFSFRSFNTTTSAWNPWVSISQSVAPVNVTPASGFTLPTSEVMRTTKNGDQVIGDGYVVVATPGTLAFGATIATLGIGFRPSRASWGVQLAVYASGTTWEYVKGKIDTAGVLTLQQAVTISASRIYFGPASWAT
ncbi:MULTISPECIES: SGNH/GDSL hydrolase family protein [unclassified Aurantimonas]|uniref:SGNH/GDSL hydrolase family protein n=1 Tax=unclassified Aurantimonas TaxID=2638230 RepID=UPI002E19431F|nr:MULTISPECIES: SGNH/GDSL hydrolase family protein [unclassified Aurantimonas]MEC5291576.1 SGNH/GDSL hydrolase family protein [Aurantimonas sp. C2-3-R2]MEC5412660.1 SGNH/GDSL hydrolase family protein [Aurantimonas sp. C2-4-R8]